MQYGLQVFAESGTDGDSGVDEAQVSDHRLTINVGVSTIGDSPHTGGGYWLSKRRDGRSANWMIARWQPKNRSVVYKSTGTSDLEIAKAALDSLALMHPALHHPVPARRATLVYFIRSAHGPIKIGIAGNIETRLSTLRTMSPCSLELVATCGGGSVMERKYHERFAEHRLHGEWFNPHPDILAEIERLTTRAQGMEIDPNL